MFMFFLGIGLTSLIIIIFLELNSFFSLLPISKSFITMNLTLLDSQSLLIIIIHAFLSVVGGIFITYGYQKERQVLFPFLNIHSYFFCNILGCYFFIRLYFKIYYIWYVTYSLIWNVSII